MTLLVSVTIPMAFQHGVTNLGMPVSFRLPCGCSSLCSFRVYFALHLWSMFRFPSPLSQVVLLILVRNLVSSGLCLRATCSADRRGRPGGVRFFFNAQMIANETFNISSYWRIFFKREVKQRSQSCRRSLQDLFFSSDFQTTSQRSVRQIDEGKVLSAVFDRARKFARTAVKRRNGAAK